MSRPPWFRTRASGLGWTPITWQGWLVTVLGAAAFVAADLLVMGRLGVFRR
ncbi:MAG TPA: hypothetical protein VII73_00645 [Caulobacteraceae bacterium]